MTLNCCKVKLFWNFATFFVLPCISCMYDFLTFCHLKVNCSCGHQCFILQRQILKYDFTIIGIDYLWTKKAISVNHCCCICFDGFVYVVVMTSCDQWLWQIWLIQCARLLSQSNEGLLAEMKEEFSLGEHACNRWYINSQLMPGICLVSCEFGHGLWYCPIASWSWQQFTLYIVYHTRHACYPLHMCVLFSVLYWMWFCWAWIGCQPAVLFHGRSWLRTAQLYLRWWYGESTQWQ